MAQVLYAQPKAPREANPAVSVAVAVDALILRAMAKQAADRFQTPNGFIDAIDDLLTSPERPARSPEPGQPAIAKAVPAPGSHSWMQRLFRHRGGR